MVAKEKNTSVPYFCFKEKPGGSCFFFFFGITFVEITLEVLQFCFFSSRLGGAFLF